MMLADRRLHVALLVALPFLVYSNNYRHDYQLDDGYTITSNPHVRSLAEIPRYFVDPSTYTSLREQVDYRPVLQVTYALNYRMGEYETPWWHLTQILLHIIVTIGIYLLCRRILIQMGDPAPDTIAFLAGVVFAIHPAASGVVNYLNARSSLLTAAFLLPALLAYVRKPIEGEGYARPAWTAAILYGLALFTKVEAIGALGTFWGYELWQRGRESPAAGLAQAFGRSFDRRTLRRMAPALIVTAGYLVLRKILMADYPFGAARHAADVGPYTYLLTQITAWWYYLLRWIAPVRLIADYATYPVYRSWHDPVVLLAAGGWLVVATLLAAAWRRAPYLLFLAIAALALLSPTSSVAPLAEMVNEHRPYLPIGILSLALFIPTGRRLRDAPRGAARAILVMGIGLALVSLGALTYRRNEVFSTQARYWQDILAKAPSARAHLNYGRTFFADDDMESALRHFQQSLDMAPYWYITHLNLAAAYERLDQTDRAREHYDRAVQYDQHSGMALNQRGQFHLRQGEYQPALEDFQRSLPISLGTYSNVRGLATAYAGLGDVTRSLEQVERMLELDRAAALHDIPAVSLPYFQVAGNQTAGVEFYERLSRRLPDTWWVHENLSRIAALAGDTSRAAEAHGRAAELGAAGPQPERPAPSAGSEEATMKEGLDLLYAKNDPAAAAARFRQVLAMNPGHYGAHYQLAAALDRAGRPDEARPVWEQVLQMAERYNDPKTAETARRRLEQGP